MSESKKEDEHTPAEMKILKALCAQKDLSKADIMRNADIRHCQTLDKYLRLLEEKGSVKIEINKKGERDYYKINITREGKRNIN